MLRPIEVLNQNSGVAGCFFKSNRIAPALTDNAHQKPVTTDRLRPIHYQGGCIDFVAHSVFSIKIKSAARSRYSGCNGSRSSQHVKHLPVSGLLGCAWASKHTGRQALIHSGVLNNARHLS